MKLTSTAAADAQSVLQPGAGKIEGVDGIAVRQERGLDVMVWNYREEEAGEPARKTAVEISGLPETLKTINLEMFQMDGEHSNSYAAWQRMGSPQSPTTKQYAELESSGKLQRVGPALAVHIEKGKGSVMLDLPVEGVALLRFTW